MNFRCHAVIKPYRGISMPQIPGYVAVDTVWDEPVTDRPCTGGIVVGPQHVDRVVKCINDQAAYKNIRLATDVNGKTYVAADCLFCGRHLNYFLKKLGY